MCLSMCSWLSLLRWMTWHAMWQLCGLQSAGWFHFDSMFSFFSAHSPVKTNEPIPHSMLRRKQTLDDCDTAVMTFSATFFFYYCKIIAFGIHFHLHTKNQSYRRRVSGKSNLSGIVCCGAKSVCVEMMRKSSALSTMTTSSRFQWVFGIFNAELQ